jgi:hypothetical protein
MTRITIILSDQDKKALIALAEKEFRDPHAQAALIIRLELQRQGFIEQLAPIVSAEIIQTSAEKEINVGATDDKQE